MNAKLIDNTRRTQSIDSMFDGTEEYIISYIDLLCFPIIIQYTSNS